MKHEYVSPTVSIYTEDEQNKKEFLKEALAKPEPKKSIYDFLIDRDSYKQFRDCCDDALLNMDFKKIHRVMKMLNWRWCVWEDRDFNHHENSVPNEFGIRDSLYRRITEFEKYIMDNPQQTAYYISSGGWEIDVQVCEYDPDLNDDWENRVSFTVRFVLEDYSNSY